MPKSDTRKAASNAAAAPAESAPIVLSGVSTLSLQSVNVSFEQHTLNGITGPSGSGKTALVIHTLVGLVQQVLFAALPEDAHISGNFVEPKVESSSGLVPSIDVLQFARGLGAHAVHKKKRSRARALDVAALLDLMQPTAALLANLGVVRCARTDCGMKVANAETARSALAAFVERGELAGGRVLFGAVFRNQQTGAKKQKGPWFAELADRVAKVGYRRFIVGGRAIRLTGDEAVDWKTVLKGTKAVPDQISVVVDSLSLDSAVAPEGMGRFAEIEAQVFALGTEFAELILVPGGVNPFQTGEVDSRWEGLILARGSYCGKCGRSAPALRPELVLEKLQADLIAQDANLPPLDVYLDGHGTGELKNLPAQALLPILKISPRLSSNLDALVEAGLGHLPLGRELSSLSDGERILLACVFLKVVGITGTILVLDEPSRVLHPKNMDALQNWARQMIGLGNTVIAAERNVEFLSRCDAVLELGPGSGAKGGRSIFQGTGAEWIERKSVKRESLTIGAAEPGELLPGTLTAIVGVSGSGKTRMLKELAEAKPKSFRAAKYLGSQSGPVQKRGMKHRETVAEVTGIFELLAALFAALPLARKEGYSAEDLLLRTPRLRCEGCRGKGVIEVGSGHQVRSEPCDVCLGHRYGPAVNELLFNEKSIVEILALTAAEALPVFANQKELAAALQLLGRLGLSHLRLGAVLDVLAQADVERLRLAALLANGGAKKTLYLLDQPFAGLTADDIESCSRVLRDAAERNGSAFVYSSHQPAAVEAADRVIALK